MSYLGLDVGTTGCKAVVFDKDGRQLASAYREYPVVSANEGWAEIDSRLVSESCLDVIREAAAECPEDRVRAMGISSQGEAFTPVGPDGEMLGNGMVSSDARAASYAEDWSREFGRERLYQITGHTAHPMFTLFKLLWVRDNLPDVWARAARFLCYEDLIHLKLGLEPAISWPLAGRTMMFDVRKHEWSPEILGAVGLDSARLPRTLPAGAVVGTIPSHVARSLGLRDGVIVVAGGHDQTCGALGAGVASKGRAVYATGTVECITPAFQEPIFSAELYEKNLCTYDFTVKGMYTTVAFSLTGGNLLKWFRDQWSREEVAESERTGMSAYELILRSMPDEPTKLMVLPYFTPTGTPYFDTEVKGAILGLRLSSTRGEVLRALLEGVAFEMRLNMDILDRSGIQIDELVAIGGGARNRRWTQLKADVMGKPISTAAVTEAGCLGVAMLARAADTGENITDLAKSWVRITDTVEPDASNAAFYADKFSSYLELYPALRRLA